MADAAVAENAKEQAQEPADTQQPSSQPAGRHALAVAPEGGLATAASQAHAAAQGSGVPGMESTFASVATASMAVS